MKLGLQVVSILISLITDGIGSALPENILPRNDTMILKQLTKRSTGTFQAFFGDHCDSGPGSIIKFTQPFTGPCIKTQDRHSFFVGGDCPNPGVAVFAAEGCVGSSVVDIAYAGNGCFNVNTGGNWGSATPYCDVQVTSGVPEG